MELRVRHLTPGILFLPGLKLFISSLPIAIWVAPGLC